MIQHIIRGEKAFVQVRVWNLSPGVPPGRTRSCLACACIDPPRDVADAEYGRMRVFIFTRMKIEINTAKRLPIHRNIQTSDVLMPSRNLYLIENNAEQIGHCFEQATLYG